MMGISIRKSGEITAKNIFAFQGPELELGLFPIDTFPNGEKIPFSGKTFLKYLAKRPLHVEAYPYMLRKNEDRLSIGGVRLIWGYCTICRALYGRNRV